MKVIQAILIVSLSLLFFNCGDDDKNSLNFSAVALKQTQWTGTLYQSYISHGESYNNIYNIGVIFYSETEGKTTVTPQTTPENSYDSNFKFSINEKLLSITNGGDIEGQWLLIESNHNKIILEQGTGGKNASKKVLTLNRAY